MFYILRSLVQRTERKATNFEVGFRLPQDRPNNMNAANFNYLMTLLLEMNEQDEKLNSNPFNRVAANHWQDIYNELKLAGLEKFLIGAE